MQLPKYFYLLALTYFPSLYYITYFCSLPHMTYLPRCRQSPFSALLHPLVGAGMTRTSPQVYIHVSIYHKTIMKNPNHLRNRLNNTCHIEVCFNSTKITSLFQVWLISFFQLAIQLSTVGIFQFYFNQFGVGVHLFTCVHSKRLKGRQRTWYITEGKTHDSTVPYKWRITQNYQYLLLMSC